MELVKQDPKDEPNRCNECGCLSTRLIEIGEPRQLESDTAIICGKCLKKAIDVLKSEGGE